MAYVVPILGAEELRNMLVAAKSAASERIARTWKQRLPEPERYCREKGGQHGRLEEISAEHVTRFCPTMVTTLSAR